MPSIRRPYAKSCLYAIALAALTWTLVGSSTSSAWARSPLGAVLSAGTSYPPIGASVDTAAPAAAGGYEIEIGGNCLGTNFAGCTVRHYPYGSKPAQMLVLKRSSLQVVLDEHLGASPLYATLVNVQVPVYASGNYIVILAGLPGTAYTPLYRTAVSLITGASASGSLCGTCGWAAIGTPSAQAGDVTGVVNPGFITESGHVQGDLRGYLQLAANPTIPAAPPRYSFTTGRYLSYNTHASGSGNGVDVITIGGSTYSLTLPSYPTCTGGYAFVVVNAINLAVVSQTAIATNCPGRGQDQAGINAVNAELSAAAHVQSEIVFMQSIGNPFNPGSTLQPLAAQAGSSIETLGGSAEVWNRSLAAGGYLTNGTSGYAMVGSPAIQADAAPGSWPESYAPVAATALTGQPARLQGILRTDQNYNYLPLTGASTPGRLPPSLATIVYGKSAAWPTGGTTGLVNSSGQLGVLTYISNGMPRGDGTTRFPPLQYSPASSCYRPVTPDVRFEYCDAAVDWSSIFNEIDHFTTPPPGCNCSVPDWTLVRQDLKTEITDRHYVESYLPALSNVYGNGTNCTKALVALSNITQQIRGAVTVSNNSLISGGRWDALAADSFNMLSALSYSDPDIAVASNALNDISALGYLIGDALGFSQNGNSLASKVSTTAAELGPKLQQIFCNADNGLGQDAAIILSDYGKLQTAATSKSFQYNNSTLKQVRADLQVGAQRFIYEHLLRVVYHPYVLLQGTLNPVGTSPLKYRCGSNASLPGIHYQPWAKAPTGGWTPLSSLDPPDPWAKRRPLGIVFSEPVDFRRVATISHAAMPPQTVMTAVTGSIASGGLGENPLELFLHNFHRYAVLCGKYHVFKGYADTTYGPSSVSWP